MKIFIVAITSIFFSVAAQFALKNGMSSEDVRSVLAQHFTLRSGWEILTHRWILLGFVLYGLGAVAWLAVLSAWDVSKAYPIVGLGFALTLGIGVVIGEQVTTLRVVGVLLICIGVALSARS